MRILITNDDGIWSEGLGLLVEWAKSVGTVTICAPKGEQSGKAQSINIHTPFEIKRVEYPGVEEAWMVDSTPDDCVRFAIDRLPPFDIVMSGINKGFNLGEDIAYSGTCGAIFEAPFWRKKGIAFSCGFSTFSSFMPNIGRIWQYFQDNRLLEKSSLWNVNIPDTVEGIRLTRQGGDYYQDHFLKIGDSDMWKQRGYSRWVPSDRSFDTDAVLGDNMISITPLRSDRTDDRAYSLVDNKDLKF